MEVTAIKEQLKDVWDKYSMEIGNGYKNVSKLRIHIPQYVSIPISRIKKINVREVTHELSLDNDSTFIVWNENVITHTVFR